MTTRVVPKFAVLPPPTHCTYVMAVKGGYEYGYETVTEKGRDEIRTKHKRGHAKTIEDALRQNGMSPIDKETLCSGKHSHQSHGSPSKRRGRPPRSEPQYSSESESTTL